MTAPSLPPIEPTVIYGGTLYDRVEVRIADELAGVLMVPGGRGDELAELLTKGMVKTRVRAIDALRSAASAVDVALAAYNADRWTVSTSEVLHRAREEALAAADAIEIDIRRPEGA